MQWTSIVLQNWTLSILELQCISCWRYNTLHSIDNLEKALNYCHKVGIAHRDVNPNNILITFDSSVHLTLVDFHLAQYIGALDCACGTVPYVPPEFAWMGTVVVQAKSDVWNAGMVFANWVFTSIYFCSQPDDITRSAKCNYLTILNGSISHGCRKGV